MHRKWIFGVAAVAQLLCACNDIDADDRYIEMPAVEAARVVLVEEYTGQNCSNCPAAHEVLGTLLEQHAGNMIVVSFHGGPMAMSEENFPTIGLSNSESEIYYGASGVSAPPAAIINRTSGVVAKDKWASEVRDAKGKASKFDLEVKAELSADGNEIMITTSIEPYATLTANLQLWITESAIVGYQLFDSGVRFDYEHNHVFRAAVNGIAGEELSFVNRESKELTHTIAVRNDKQCVWNTDNLQVVAFLYNEEGVLQAAFSE